MKYFSKKVKNEYGVFDSKAEYERFLYLKHQEDIGVISDLKTQVKFEILPKLIKKVNIQLKTKIKVVERVDDSARHYTADFTYTNSQGQYVISELKSKGTALARDYSLRRSLVKRLIHKHNEDVGFEDWVFEEIVEKKKPRKKK